MRAILILAIALTMAMRATAGWGGPANKSSESEPLWGAPANGLSTRVASLENDPSIGKPLKVRLEVKNVDTAPRSYDDQQAAVNGSIIVKGPDGKDVPYIGTSFQTMGQKTTLAPGATNTVVKELDVASQYLLDKAGKYTLQFRARGGLPASNELAVTLKAGELADAMKLFAAIHRATPVGWRAARYADSIVVLNTPTSLKADATSVSLYFTKDDKPAMHLQTPPTDLGMTKLGHAWLVPEAKAAERWPNHVKFFEEQLKPFAKAK